MPVANNGVDVLLIHPPYHRRNGSGVTFPLGLGYLAATARDQGFSVGLIDCALYFDSLTPAALAALDLWLESELRRMPPRLAVGVGPCTTSAARALKVIASVFHRVLPDIPVTYGGPLASINEQEWFFFNELEADAVVAGDGEVPFKHLLHAFANGMRGATLPSVSWSGDSTCTPYVESDLDGLPFPARDLANKAEYSLSVRRDLGHAPFATLVGSRGCTHRCKFCMSGAIRDGKYTRRSVKNVGAEVANLVAVCKTRCLVFYDDTLLSTAGRASEELVALAGVIAEVSTSVVWQFETRPDIASGLDRDALKYAYAHGCRQINIGIEKSTDHALNGLGKGHDSEQSRSICVRIAETCPEMRLAGTFILGGPEEDEQSVIETIDFARTLPLTFAHFSPLELYPGTVLYQQEFGNNPRRWYEVITRDPSPIGEIIFESNTLPRDRLLSLISEAYARFYGDAVWKARAARVLGTRYDVVFRQAQEWSRDRLRLG